MSYIIVGLHGLANKPPAKNLDDWWKKSILEGLARNCGRTSSAIKFTSVYWADQRYPKPDDPKKMVEPYLKATGTGPLKTHKDSLFDDFFGDGRMLLQESAQLVVDNLLDDSLYVCITQLALCLTFKLRLRDFYA